MPFRMVEFRNGNWQTVEKPNRQFDKDVEQSVIAIAKSTKSKLGTSNLTPYDFRVTQGDTAGMNLCHLISINCMARMVCEYLNGNVNVYQFVEMTGAVYFPSNMVLIVPQACWAFFCDWANSIMKRLNTMSIPNKNALNGATASDKEKAEFIANDLLKTMNSARNNLRFGDGTTNKSIGKQLDPRDSTGWTIDPVTCLERLAARIFGKPLASLETSYAFYTIADFRMLINEYTPDTVASRKPKQLQNATIMVISSEAESLGERCVLA